MVPGTWYLTHEAKSSGAFSGSERRKRMGKSFQAEDAFVVALEADSFSLHGDSGLCKTLVALLLVVI